MMRYLDFLSNPDVIRSNAKKMTAPLISLLSGGREPEIEYVALKNIAIILQKRPIVIEKEIKMFFCNFNDPIYIKL
jgi:vesicle coat complex subunit